MRSRHPVSLAGLVLLFFLSVRGQSPNGTISGLVTDSSGAAVAGADILIENDATGVQNSAKTNRDGIYVLSNLPPGRYRLQVERVGFKTLIKPDIVLNVQGALAVNFTLPVGAVSETVTVQAGASVLDTENIAVSTVVDRQFAENLPMNGRSFQTLIELAPGVVLTPSYQGAEGQFSVNGQRTTSNNWTVDGVSANIGIGANSNGGNGVAGTLGSFSVLGGTNSLVSVDALREFRIQTSTYAPEFGRTPGAQISIVTRSGTDQFHGTAFDYLRNSALDSNTWFADRAGLSKPAERQNDFGGTLGGPIIKDRTFFFFSYEGLRLRLPQTTLTTVPDLSARQTAPAVIEPFLEAYPKPNGPDDEADGIAQFNASYSNPATLDAYSLRIDHTLNSRISLFGRYDYSPSGADDRGSSTLYPLNDILTARIVTQTGTMGFTWEIDPFTANDFRFNYSATRAASSYDLDGFGGATPLQTLPFPSAYSSKNSQLVFTIYALSHPYLSEGTSTTNTQRQINLVDSLSKQKGTHSIKFGFDYRRLMPSFDPALYVQQPIFLNVESSVADDPLGAIVTSARSADILFQNLGVFAQDTWRIIPRMTMTYGLRWDVDFVPSSTGGAALPAVTGYNLTDPSELALAPSGTSPFTTMYDNVAPRLGLAFNLSTNPNWGSVVRGGVGVFYDLATSQVGDAIGTNYPFGASTIIYGPPYGGTATFPLSPIDALPPAITPANLSSPGATLVAMDPGLKLPYTLEWNVALQQELGSDQSVTISYIGSGGRRMIQSAYISAPTPTLYSADLIGNTASSSYNALQLQFQRRLTNGLQVLSSYTWSHSIDDGSNGSYGIGSNSYVPAASRENRGSSDFDIRNALSAALTYELPRPRHVATAAIFGGWALDDVVQAWSAPPVNIYYSEFGFLSGAYTQVRPDVVSGAAVYLYGPQYPGGKAFNSGAFAPPPIDANGNPSREGTLGRNALRGFGAAQWDFAVHRDFSIRDVAKLQFRAEVFNILNHPNFAPPAGDLQSPLSINSQFGLSTETLGQYLGSANVGGGGLSSLYQIGGPRSVQFALKFIF